MYYFFLKKKQNSLKKNMKYTPIINSLSIYDLIGTNYAMANTLSNLKSGNLWDYRVAIGKVKNSSILFSWDMGWGISWQISSLKFQSRDKS